MIWKKSSASLGDGECVEVTHDGSDVLVRNSRFPAGAWLRFTAAEWEAFRAGVLAGEFDLPEVSG